MSSDTQDLPYNPSNILLEEEDLYKFLKDYDIDIKINNINTYRRAFVHKSYCTRKNENYIDGNINCPKDCLPLQEDSNERLEFLGDSVLNIITTKYLFDRYPNVNEGFLTKMRTKFVNGNMLANLSDSIGFNKFILMSCQIDNNNGRNNKNILEDTFEAFIGALFIDTNSYEICGKWIINIFEEHIDFTELMKTNVNFKDKLVKHCQHNYQFIPKFYEVDITEKNGKKIHTICVKDVSGNIIGIGKDNSKKQAEIIAAKKALTYYGI
jgi:ribonuclease III